MLAMAQHEDNLQRGIRLFQMDDLEGAELCLKEVQGEPLRERSAQIYLGQVYLRTERAEFAVECFRAAASIQRDAQVFLLLGEAHFALGANAKAEAAFLEAMRRDPESPGPCIMLGHAIAAQDRIQEAIRAYEQALLRDPFSASARYFLSESLIRSGDILRARSQLHMLLQREPTYAPAILLMGDIAYHQKDFRQAVVEYCRGIALETPEADVYERLGNSFLGYGDFVQALRAYEASIKAYPTYWPCYLAAAKLCEDRKWMKKARRYYHATVFLPEHREEATEGIARINSYFAQFDLGEDDPKAAPEQPVPDESDRFEAPDTYTQPAEEPQRTVRAFATQPLDPTDVERHLPKAAPKPETRGPDLERLTGKLKDALEDTGALEAGQRVLKASQDFLPKGLDKLKGFLKRER